MMFLKFHSYLNRKCAFSVFSTTMGHQNFITHFLHAWTKVFFLQNAIVNITSKTDLQED